MAPLPLRREGHAGFAIGIKPDHFEDPKGLVLLFQRCIVYKWLTEDNQEAFSEVVFGANFDPGKMMEIDGENEVLCEGHRERHSPRKALFLSSSLLRPRAPLTPRSASPFYFGTRHR